MPRKGDLIQFLLDALTTEKYPNLVWLDITSMKFALLCMNIRNRNCPRSFKKIYEDWHAIKKRSNDVGDIIDRLKSALKTSEFLINCKSEWKRNEQLVFQFKFQVFQKVEDFGEQSPFVSEVIVDSPSSEMSNCDSPESPVGDVEALSSVNKEVGSVGSPESDAGYFSSPDSPGCVSFSSNQTDTTTQINFDDAMLENDDLMKFVTSIIENDSSDLSQMLQDVDLGFLDGHSPPESPAPNLTDQSFTTPEFNSIDVCSGKNEVLMAEPIENSSPHTCIGRNFFDSKLFPCNGCKNLTRGLLSGTSSEPVTLPGGTTVGVTFKNGKKYFVAMRQLQPM